MIIDFHTHIFPKAIRENRQKYFLNESAFKLLYNSPGSKLVGATEIVASMDEQGVDKSVVFGFPWKTKKTFQVQNDYIMEVVARYPEQLIGLACFDPFHGEAVPEAVRCIEGGLLGIGEIAFYESGIDDTALDKLVPLMEICRNRDLPFLIHTNEPVGHIYPGKTPNTMKQIYDLIKRFPENKIVLAHWGGGIFFFNLLKKDVKERLENGMIEEVRVWNRALSNEEIKEMMFKELDGTETNLQAYYQFNETSGDVLPDITANNNDGDVGGNPGWTASYAPLASVLLDSLFNIRGVWNAKTSHTSSILTISAVLSRKSTEMYASFWKNLDLRKFFMEILLAVRLATAPLSNSSLTLAISGVSLTTLTPLAWIFLMFDLTTLRTISISWIIRSKTTGTSVPLGLN